MFSFQADKVERHGGQDGDDETRDEDEQDQVDGVVRHGPETKVQEQAERHQKTYIVKKNILII